MSNTAVRFQFCYILTFTADDVALALGCVGHDPNLWRWTSRFCASAPSGCTLGASEALGLIGAVERLIRRNRASLASGIDRSIVVNLEALFRVFVDAIERCLDLEEVDCVCSWERRMGDAEKLTRFLIAVAQAYWSTGADREWMFKELEDLACRANEVSERDGSIARRAEDDSSVEARADRLSRLLFDAANDLWCDNWSLEEFMRAACFEASLSAYRFRDIR